MDHSSLTYIFLYTFVLLICLASSLILWRQTRARQYLLLCHLWLATLFVALSQVIVDHLPLLLRSYHFSFTYLCSLAVVRLLVHQTQVRAHFRAWHLIMASGGLLTLLLYLVHAPPPLLALPITLAAGMPLFDVNLRLLIRDRKRLPFSTQAFSVSSLLLAVHGIACSWLVHDPQLEFYSLTGAFLLLCTMSIFSLASALEMVTTERAYDQAEREAWHRQKAILDNIPDMAWLKDIHGGYLAVNEPFALACGHPVEAILGKGDHDIWSRAVADKYCIEDFEVMRHGQGKRVEELLSGQEEEQWIETIKTPVFNERQVVVGMTGIARDITQRKRAEKELETLHKSLVATARDAGKAEIASSVLHNVGNVLNSINISVQTVTERIQQLKAEQLRKVIDLMRQHHDDLGSFLSNHERGRSLPLFLEKLVDHLIASQQEIAEELVDLQKNVDHIKTVINLQQKHARRGGVRESFSMGELLEDALQINKASLDRHHIRIWRAYDHSISIATDKHQLLQVLVNLISNAKYAVIHSQRADKKITLRTTVDESGVRIDVEDTGVGIPPENIDKIFTYGFTTRKEGHGYGLHSAALAIQELGGVLTVQSNGVEQGTLFTVHLPHAVLQPDEPVPQLSPGERGDRAAQRSDAPDQRASSLGILRHSTGNAFQEPLPGVLATLKIIEGS